MQNEQDTKKENTGTFYDQVILRLNNQVNDLTTKYKQALLTIAELQKELTKENK